MSGVRGVAVLGSTGSIGRSTLSVIELHPQLFRVAMVGAHSSWQTVVEQARRFEPDVAVLVDAVERGIDKDLRAKDPDCVGLAGPRAHQRHELGCVDAADIELSGHLADGVVGLRVLGQRDEGAVGAEDARLSLAIRSMVEPSHS